MAQQAEIETNDIKRVEPAEVVATLDDLRKAA